MIQIRYHINHKDVITYAIQNNLSRLEAMAILTGKEIGIVDDEMEFYINIFHENMKLYITVEEAIEMALIHIILKYKDNEVKDNSRFEHNFSEN